MNKFDKVLICLDLTEMDHFLISYSNFIIKTFKPEKVIFMHVMATYDIPVEIMESLDDTGGDLEDAVREELDERIESGLSFRGETEISIVIEKGMTTEKIVQFSRKNKIDLTVFGKKIGYVGEGSVARKIVGLVPSSVLVINETSQPKISKILVRMDFSKMAHTTLLMAKTISDYTGALVECHHVYKLPLNYFPKQTPENIKKLKMQLGQFVDKEYSKFVTGMKVNDPPPISYSLEIQSDESHLLYNHAIQKGFDLILTGTKIKSPLANLILDSTSEKLVGSEKSIPVMVVKDMGRSVGILKAIFD